MGACQFEVTSYGKTAEAAYTKACERAEDEYGSQDGYNGTISTTHGFRDETEAYSKSKFDDVSSYIHNKFDSHSMNKRDCSAICVVKPVGNKNKTKTQVDHIVTPGTKKWVLRYVVQHGDHIIGIWPTKGDAVKDARKYTERNIAATTILMKKFLEKGDNLVAKITYKKATNERDGEWIFFGYAAE